MSDKNDDGFRGYIIMLGIDDAVRIVDAKLYAMNMKQRRLFQAAWSDDAAAPRQHPIRGHDMTTHESKDKAVAEVLQSIRRVVLKLGSGDAR